MSSSSSEVERYMKDPSRLVELCREVIDRLDAEVDNSDTAAMEAQLREIARAIDKLDKLGVQVPDALRAEKTRLAAALGINSETTQTLNHLADEFQELLKDLKSRIGRTPETSPSKKNIKRSKTPKTDKTILRKFIVEALQYFGGSAQKNDVLKYMEKKLHGKLLSGDLEWRDATNDYVWQNNACWERNSMKNEGILKSGSPRGVWELE